MKYNVYSVRDIKAGAFIAPFILANDEMACRAVEQMVKSDNHMFNANPEDFTLFRIGTFDDENGLLEPVVPPVHVADAIQFRPSDYHNQQANMKMFKEFLESQKLESETSNGT